MKHLFYFTLITLHWGISFHSSAQFIELSPSAKISLITPEPGQEAIFTVFGHSAIRVFDPINNIDVAFDYGIFDYDDPNFNLNFAKGYLNYSVGTREFDRFAYTYQYFNRSIHEQLLNLTQEEKQAVFEYLANNALPENKYYFYDYFYDNCSTRLWYVLEEVLGEKLVFDENYVSGKKSFRYMVDSLAIYQPWGELGIDICLGLPMDKIMSPKEFMFLPGYLQKSIDYAKINHDGVEEQLVINSSIIFQAEPQELSAGFFTPKLVFWSLFLLILGFTILGFKKQNQGFLLDIILFSLFGLLGIFLMLLWFATDHTAASWNLNLLWAIPFHLVAALFLISKNKRQLLLKYFLATAVLMVVLLIGWVFIPQGYNPAFYPLVALLALRASFVYYRLKNTTEVISQN